MSGISCRFCDRSLAEPFLRLGSTPLANSYLSLEGLDQPEVYYPLNIYRCGGCGLVQLPNNVSTKALFEEYAYFSSYSDSWMEHCRLYAESMIRRLGLGPASLVVEVASNDGYLLGNFLEAKIPVLGIEPAKNVAREALGRGIPTESDFFNVGVAQRLAREGRRADLLIANNVLAHVPDLNDFVAGLRVMLKSDGVLTAEFPHLLRFLEGRQFDTIYHEHHSYFSLSTARKVFRAHGLEIFDVEELATHGGSLRIQAKHSSKTPGPSERVLELERRENSAELFSEQPYARFVRDVETIKHRLLSFLIKAKSQGMPVAGYGAPAKGNTLLNYCGITTDLVAFTVDRSPHKQGRYLPGSHIPIKPPEALRKAKPSYILLLSWNLQKEIAQQTAYVRDWGGQFLLAIPEVSLS